MAPWGLLIRAVLVVEDYLVQSLLRSPSFHQAVRRVHRGVEDLRHGRDPNEPLRRGEATADPNQRSFLSHFVEELWNQARGQEKWQPPSKKK